ncbi:puromycin-sensitive aminopeptidase isoform X2 [Nilaparvata lugens]|uniref:puromycin-sensitive aminopeptidase isoform X2 n=1 Tax=Nilaparvata lugens TaxID=108931 RepID=UPI00193CB328|nr:puromycin-sensitive aminopeptidase isoform X2 [Nilaparvata lugens]
MSFIHRSRKPVSIVKCFCRYRYTDSRSKQESGIRVSRARVNFGSEIAYSYRSASHLVNCSLPAFNCITDKSNTLLSFVCKYYSTVERAKLEVNSSILPAMPEKKPFQRLPTTVEPKLYKLYFKPDLKQFSFEGTETVNVVINESVNEIILNSFELQIGKVELTDVNGEVHKPQPTLLAEDESLILKFEKQLPCGEASIYFEFVGELNDKLIGFYRSKCNPATAGGGGGGEEKYAAVTQFQATHARRCFPCWDEPAIKAVFDITITAPKDNVALSNMPAIAEKAEANGDKTVTFATTPQMSTYLVAMVVGDLDFVEDRSEDGVLVRVYTEPGKAKQGHFALFVATKVLPYYKQYFNIAYPLPKIDLVAVADFSAGAMENWGLVTYRETCLLVDTENTSSMRKQIIALTIGHEIAHQWFGNLVTMEWWTHLWLNEGYASFVEYLCVAHLFPEYEIWTQFISQHTRALELDSLDNSHPIQVPVGHPSEIDEIFDDISYSKGASIIRMLHNYIGDDDFRKGMNLYLTRYQYKNTFTEDLWAALEEASSKPVQAVMSTWTCQKGFPVVTVDTVKSPHDNPNSRTFKVSQTKFYAAGNKPQNNGDSPLWLVPLTYSKGSDPCGKFACGVLDKPEMTVTISDVQPDEWVKFNPNTVGFYRTKYTTQMLDQFLPSIQAKTMPPLDRLGLVDDLFALVQAGQAPTVQVLKLIQAMTHEDNFTVWSAISDCLGKVKVLIENTDFEDAFYTYGQKLFKEIAKKLGWEPKAGESHTDALLRSLVISRLGATFRDAEVIAEAQKRFAAHLSGERPIPADLRSPIYRVVMAAGDETTFDQMIKLYKENDLHEEKDRIGCALGQTRKKELLKRTLEFAISDDVRTQASPIIIVYVTGSVMARELSWQFVKDNWTLFSTRYESGFLLSRLVKYTVEDFVSEERALEVEEFFKEREHSNIERTVQQACETIRLNAAWLNRDRQLMKEFLTSAN